MMAPDTVAIAVNRAAFDDLKRAAASEARGAVAALTRVAPWKFAPSRLTRKSAADLADVFAATYNLAIEKRLAQLDRLNRKLARSDPGWTLLTHEQLRAHPDLPLADMGIRHAV